MRSPSATLPRGALLVVVGKDGTPRWYAKFRWQGTQKKPLLGLAWIEPRGRYSGTRRGTSAPGWIHRSGRPADGWLDEAAARARMAEKIAEVVDGERRARESDGKPLTFGDAAAGWLQFQRSDMARKGTTMRDYEAMLRRADESPRLRGRAPRARFAPLLDRELGSITTEDVKSFLSELDRDPQVSARTVNKYRTTIGAIFRYAIEELGAVDQNPVRGVRKRNVADGEAYRTYTPEQVELIARKARARPREREAVTVEEVEARRWDDERDAVAILVAAFAGLRQGELLALRWRDVNWTAGNLLVRRAYSAGLGEDTPKSGRHRVVPMSDQVAAALDGLSRRPHFAHERDLVFCGRDGRHLDPKGLRDRYRLARDAAMKDDPDMLPLRFHDLRHAFGTIAAGMLDLATVKTLMGHQSIRTTEGYLHARPNEAMRDALTRAFGSPLPPQADEATGRPRKRTKPAGRKS